MASCLEMEMEMVVDGFMISTKPDTNGKILKDAIVVFLHTKTVDKVHY
jgi:hypothetical protein